MKFKTGLAIACSLGMSVFINGCSSDDDDATPSSILCYLTSEQITGTQGSSGETFAYTGSNALSSITITIGSQTATYTPTFDANGKITKLSFGDGSYASYTYGTDGFLSESLTVDSKGNSLGKNTYSYNASGQLIQEQDYGLVNGEPPLSLVSHDIYTYTDATTKNALTDSYYLDYQTSKLSYTDTYEYDTHKVPSVIPGTPGSSNNVTKITRNNSTGTLVNTTTYVYTYNDNDYPLTEQMNSTGNSNGLVAQSSTTTYSYNCK